MARVTGSASVASYASAASQTKFENLTGIAVKIRIKGSMLTALTGYSAFIHVFTLPKQGLTLFVQNNGDDPTNATKSLWAYENSNGYTRTDFTWTDASNDVVLYYHYDHSNGFRLEAYNPTTGTLLGSGAGYAGLVGDLPTGSGTGAVTIGETGTVHAATDFDGVAVYSAALTGANRYNIPYASDTNVVAYYPFDEGSGTTSVDLVSGSALTLTALSWTTGGMWAPPGSAPPYAALRRYRAEQFDAVE